MNISINVTNKIASVVGSPVIVCGNSDYALDITFDSEWEGQTAKTARFVYVKDGEVKCADVVFSGITANVPKLMGTKEVYIGIYAGDLKTTTPARVPCQQSIRCMEGAPEDPTPSQYDQIIALLNSVSSIDVSAMLKYTPQTLSEAQKAQARENLDVPSNAKLTEGLNLVLDFATARPPYTYGTTDIAAGSVSTAEAGTLHFVYE